MTVRVRPLMTGPIIGHTSKDSFRLWGRAKSAEGAIGVARIRLSDGVDFSTAVTFEFNKDYDHVGIIDFNALAASTGYSYQIGWVNGYTKEQLDQLIAQDDDFAWGHPSQPDINGSLITFPVEGADSDTRFIMGSCRDPWGDKGEHSFNEIYEMASDEDERPDFLLMTGDQVYVDHAHIFKKFRPKQKKYWKTYRKAYGLNNFSKSVRQLPCYMMMDDHEVQNDWTIAKFKYDVNNPIKRKRDFEMKTMQRGLHAFEAYQACLSPLVKSVDDFIPATFVEPDDKRRYWYKFQHGASSFFVLDTRGDSEVLTKNVEENKEHEKREPKILGEKQYSELEAWLKDGKGKVKFIVSPIPLFPDTKALIGSPADKWFYAAKQRVKLLDLIRNNNLIPKVVFLSGDVHISGIAELTHADDDNFKVYNVISSALNWFTPGLQEENFSWGDLIAKKIKVEEIGDDDVAMSDYHSKSLLAWKNGRPKIIKRNNFAVIDVEQSGDEVEIYVEFFRGTHKRKSYGRTKLF